MPYVCSLLCVLSPRLQYNYVENFPTIFNSTANTFESLSYSGDGFNSTDTSAGACGCVACPSMPCGLGRSGPSRGPIQDDPRAPGNLAVNPDLEKCGGGSGNCLTINGQTCCFATDSYEYRPSPPQSACTSICENYWSSISRKQPLARLWSNISVPLPQ
jgi:hypothetical protein